MGRWLRRIAFVLLLLIVAALIVAQVILGGDIPRRQIIEAIEAETGLVVDVASCRVGWSGSTTINRLTLRIDESSEPIARVTRVDVKHNNLLSVLWSRQVRIATIDLRDATLRAKQDERDTWDVERAIERIMEQQQGKPAADVSPIITAEGLQLQASGRAVSLEGAVNVRVADEKVRIEPTSLTVTSAHGAFEPITAAGGIVRASAQRVAVEGVTIESAANTAQVDGQWTLPDGGGGHQLVASIVTAGSLGDVAWDATLQITALGPTPQQMGAHVSLTRGKISHGDVEPNDLEGLAAVIKLQYPSVQLESLAFSDRDSLKASGRINIDTHQWSANGRLGQWPIADKLVDLTVAAKGRDGVATIESFTAAVDAMTVKGSGKFDPSSDKPVDANIELAWRPDELSQGVAGAFDYRAKVRGSMDPMDMHAAGTLIATSLQYDGTALDDLSVPLELHLDDAHAMWQSEPFAMLGGHCAIVGRYRFSGGDTQLTAQLKQLALAQVAPLVGDDLTLAGTMDATVDVEPTRLAGEWVIAELRAGPLTAEDVTGRFTAIDHKLTIDPLTMHHADGSATGRMVIDMSDAQTAAGSFQIEQWPMLLRDGSLTVIVNGTCDGDINLADYTAQGSMSLQTSLASRQRDLGRFAVNGTLAGDRLVFDRIAGDVFGGHVEGNVSWHLHDHTASTGKLAISDIDAATLTSFVPELERTSGRVSGHLTMDAADERAPEPLRIDMELLPADGMLRGVPWGVTTATVYVGDTRVIVDKAQLAVADGSAGIWASISQREGEWYLQTQTDFNRIEYDHLRHSFEPDGQPVRARLTGNVRVGGAIEPFCNMTGQGRIDVTESDLANHSIFGSVMTRLGASERPTQPQGHGEATFRVERGALFIDYLDYENRGVNFRASGAINDLAAGRESPVDLNIVATNKPLVGIQLPGRSEFDRMFSSLQSNFTAFRITGTLADPAIASAAIADFASSVEGFLRRRDERQRPVAPK